MNFSRLNPVGYTSVTKQGNEYKKSNLGKTSVLGAYLAAQAADTVFKFSKGTPYEAGNALKELEKLIGKEIPSKFKALMMAAFYAIDALAFFGVGALIDKFINKSRAAKADKQA